MSDASSDDDRSDIESRHRSSATEDPPGPSQSLGKLVNKGEIASFSRIARLLSDDSEDEKDGEETSDEEDSEEDEQEETAVGLSTAVRKSVVLDDQAETLVEGRQLASVLAPQKAGPSSQRQGHRQQSTATEEPASKIKSTAARSVLGAGPMMVGPKAALPGVDIFTHRAGIVSAALRKAWELDTFINLFELQEIPSPRSEDPGLSRSEIIAPSSTALATALKQLRPKQKRRKREVEDPADSAAPSEPAKKKKRTETVKASQAKEPRSNTSAGSSTVLPNTMTGNTA